MPDVDVDAASLHPVETRQGERFGRDALLSLLAGLDAPTAGRASVDGWDLLTMSAADRHQYRRHTVGFVRQEAVRNLVPYLTARQVVDLPLSISRVPRRERRGRVDDLLKVLAVGHCADRRPAQMSGGEQMRVAIAVALANRPRVLLADEPTGELDTRTAGPAARYCGAPPAPRTAMRRSSPRSTR